MGGSHPDRAHFIKIHVKPARRKLQSGFTTGKTGTDYADPHQLTFTDW